jgi:flagellar biosynthesis component FlhA
VFFTVEYAPALAPLIAATPEAEERVRRTAESALALVLAELGITAPASVALRPGSPPDGFGVRVGGEALRLRRDRLRRLFRVMAGLGAGTSANEQLRPGEWWETLVATARTEEVRATLGQFVVSAVVEAVRTAPDRLLGEDRIRSWIQEACDHPPDAERLGRYVDRTGAVLRAVLAHGLPVADGQTIRRYLVDGMSRERSDEDIAESVIGRLQAATVDVELRPEYADAALGLRLRSPVVAVDALGDDAEARKRFGLLRDGLFYELGVGVPPIRFKAVDDLPVGAFRIRVGASPFPPWAGLAPGEILVNAPAERLHLLGVDSARPAVNPAHGGDAALVAVESRPTVEAAGLTTWSPVGYVVLAAASDLQSHGGRLLDMDAVESALAQLGTAFPGLVAAVLEKFTAAAVTRVLRRLLADEVSIRNLRAILERLLAYEYVAADTLAEIVLDRRLAIDRLLDPEDEADQADRHTEFVRAGLRSFISHKYSQGSGTLAVWLLDPEGIERPILAELADRQGKGKGQPIGRATLERIRHAVRERRDAGPHRPAILTVNQVATFLRHELRDEFPDIPIMAYQELVDDVSLVPLARIELA